MVADNYRMKGAQQQVLNNVLAAVMLVVLALAAQQQQAEAIAMPLYRYRYSDCAPGESIMSLSRVYNPMGHCVPKLGGGGYIASCDGGKAMFQLYDHEDCSLGAIPLPTTVCSYDAGGSLSYSKVFCTDEGDYYAIFTTGKKGSCTEDKKLPPKQDVFEVSAAPLNDCFTFEETDYNSEAYTHAAKFVNTTGENGLIMRFYDTFTCSSFSADPIDVQVTLGECFLDPRSQYPVLVQRTGVPMPNTRKSSGASNISTALSVLLSVLVALSFVIL